MNQHTLCKFLTPLDDDSHLFSPLSLSGVTSYLPVKKPAMEEWENEAAYPHIDLTAGESVWDPPSDFAEM